MSLSEVVGPTPRKNKKIEKRAIPLLIRIVYTYIYNQIHKYTNVATNTYMMTKNGGEMPVSC